MIKANDLRLLNAVKIINQVVFITSIGEYGMVAEEGTGQKYSDLCESDLFPITLTPEILRACGFEKDGFGSYNISISPWHETHLKQLSFAGDYLYLREGDLGKNRITDSLCVLWNNDLRGKMNLHELQNLYHLLTGAELQINEKVFSKHATTFL